MQLYGCVAGSSFSTVLEALEARVSRTVTDALMFMIYRRLQQMLSIPQTGELDKITSDVMHMERCGVSDQRPPPDPDAPSFDLLPPNARPKRYAYGKDERRFK